MKSNNINELQDEIYKLLGHSVETNQAYYKKIRMEEEVDNIRLKMNDSDVKQNSKKK